MSLAYRADPDPRGTYVDAAMRDLRAAAYEHARGWATLERTAGGYALDKRPYVALDCHCANRACPGYAMVHDEPGARLHFETLFGANAVRGGAAR